MHIAGNAEIALDIEKAFPDSAVVSLGPSKLIRMLGLPMICAAMFVVMGGHWALLQTTAWATMIVKYSQEAQSVRAGVEKTFSGEAPCAMCKKIAQAQKQEEQKSPTVKADKKLEPFTVRAVAEKTYLPTHEFHYPAEIGIRFAVRRDAPPSPVPLRA